MTGFIAVMYARQYGADLLDWVVADFGVDADAELAVRDGGVFELEALAC